MEQRVVGVRTVGLPTLDDDGVGRRRRVEKVDLLGRCAGSARDRRRPVEDAHVDVVFTVVNASNSEKRAYVVPAGTTTSCLSAFGELSEHVESVGSSDTVSALVVAATRPRAVAENAPS